MSAFHDNVLLGASGSQGYQISRSVRLRKSASAYFNRTPASASNQKTHTISFWTKWSALTTDANVISFGNTLSYQVTWGTNGTRLACGSQVLGVSNPWFVDSVAVYRDPNSWYHLVIAVDTTQATAANRVKMYVNGVQLTSFSTANYPTLNYDTGANSATAHSIGRREDNAQYYDGYFTEMNWIDGQQLTPSSFGENDIATGVWKPKKYAGTYGTNGFYLNFSDPSAATAAAIGKDYSGNGNNWTPNNISVTAGATYDSMIDVPNNYVDGGNGRGNYAVLNPLTAKSGYASTTDGNLRANFVSGANASFVLCGTFQSSGKWYCEAQIVSTGADATRPCVGIVKSSFDWNSIAVNLGDTSDSWAYLKSGSKRTASTSSAYGASYTAGDIIGIALDMDAGTVVFYKNNASQGTAFTGLSGDITFAASGYADGTTRSIDFNFGQRPFTYTPPSGYSALNTQNLPAPTIPNGANWMAATTYTGTGASRTVSNAVNSIAFQPDLVWIKSRAAANNKLTDSVRGVTKALISDSTVAETTDTNGVTAFGTTGFTVGSDVTYNQNTVTYVAWQWKKSATPGFDIVAYAGTGVAKTVAHSLGVAPKMIYTKNRTTGVANWLAYHSVLGATNYLLPNTTAASAASAAPWNNTAPTSSVFTVGTSAASNEAGSNMVAYLWAEVAGFSKFGSYTGNASTDGPFVYTGFRPRYVLIKRTDSTSDWYIWDTSRDTYNVETATLLQNTTGAETSATSIDALSNGFKCRSATVVNASAGTYVYAAFAENPFKYALAR